LDFYSTPTPNKLTPAPVPVPVLAKILNSNSCLTPVQLAGMACLNQKRTDLFINLNSAHVFRKNLDSKSTPAPAKITKRRLMRKSLNSNSTPAPVVDHFWCS